MVLGAHLVFQFSVGVALLVRRSGTPPSAEGTEDLVSVDDVEGVDALAVKAGRFRVAVCIRNNDL